MSGDAKNTTDSELRDLYPIGATVSTVVYGIGGRSEVVAGTVVDYRRRSVIAQTEFHGRLAIERAKIITQG